MRVRGFDGMAQQEPSATLLDDRLKFVGAVTASSASGPASIRKHHRLELFHHYLLGVKSRTWTRSDSESPIAGAPKTDGGMDCLSDGTDKQY
jgi:hypothetical protein